MIYKRTVTILCICSLLLVTSCQNITPRQQAAMIEGSFSLGVTISLQQYANRYEKKKHRNKEWAEKHQKRQQKGKQIAQQIRAITALVLDLLFTGNKIEISPRKLKEIIKRTGALNHQDYKFLAQVTNMLQRMSQLSVTVDTEGFVSERTRMNLMAIVRGCYLGSSAFLGAKTNRHAFQQRPGTLIWTKRFHFNQAKKKRAFIHTDKKWNLVEIDKDGNHKIISTWRKKEVKMSYILLENDQGEKARLEQNRVEVLAPQQKPQMCVGNWN